ncbi:MAG TPA: hypothetical protein VMR62_18535 [Bryobacteraceae bacterium]|nr:hypothetical protein [Bryobacteraceae bacterium]
MDHRLAQIFRVGLPLFLPKGDVVSCAVVSQNQWMVDGYIRRPLLKVTYRIASRGHHIAKQLVGFRYRAGRAIDETHLDAAPGFEEARTITWCQRADLKGLHAFGTLFESGFPTSPVTPFLHRACIFCVTEAIAQSFRPALAKEEQGPNTSHRYCDDNNPFGK